MLAPTKQKITLDFPPIWEEETNLFFPLEDLINEYNHKVLTKSPFTKAIRSPLSIKPIPENFTNPVIRPITEEELKSLSKVQSVDWIKILQDQWSQKGIVSNATTLAEGVTIAELINVLGLKGQVYHKTVNGKTYVILKGNPANRELLKGTRYLNTNPQIVRLGLAKVDVKSMVSKGFKTSFFIYGALKGLEALELILTEEPLKPSFFTEIGTALPKIGLSTLVSAAAAGFVAAAGFPVAVGAGVVLVVGFGAGFGLEFLDQRLELTKKLNETVDIMWDNLKEDSNTQARRQTNASFNPLEGLVYGCPNASYQRVIAKANCFIYAA